MIGDAVPRGGVRVSRWRRFRASIDWPLMILVLLVVAVGLFNLYSATHDTRSEAKFRAQLNFMGAGMVLCVIVTLIDYRTLLRLAWVWLGGVVLMLLLVRFVGDAAKGSARWIDVGPIRVQPSEAAKLAVILALARIFQDGETQTLAPRAWVPQVGAIVLLIGLIAIQPDLGTASLVTFIALSIGYVLLPSVWPMVATTVAGLAAIPLIWDNMVPYQKNRVLAFLDPGADPTGIGWHTQQSVFAVGSGKIWGKGYMEGTQNQFDFLPEHWTDFPFSVWAEEWGFVGSALVIVLYGCLVTWIVGVALSARDRAGSVICIGVAAMTFWHVVVNIGMVVGVAPVVGVTLPFISYGGASVLVFFAAIGLVGSVSLRKHGY